MSVVGIDDKEMAGALERIARTPDGRLFYLFLQKTLTAVPINPDSDALRTFHGRRMFAAELQAAMAEGIRASHGGSDPTERPITFLAREPVAVGARESVRSYLRRTDPELKSGDA